MDLQPVTNQLRSHLDTLITEFNISMIKKELVFMNQRYLQLPHVLAWREPQKWRLGAAEKRCVMFFWFKSLGKLR